jgi:cytochrome b561
MRMERDQYGTTARVLHWIAAALIVLQFAIGWLMPDIRRGMSPGAPMNLHMSIGAVVLALILARFAWRLAHPVAPEASLPPWQRVTSEGVHLLLYALVLATTFTGWTYASMRGWTVTLFGVLPLPALVAEGSALGRSIGRLHGTLTWVLLGVVGLHLAAALLHLLVFRDGVMARMLPGVDWPRRSGAA